MDCAETEEGRKGEADRARIFINLPGNCRKAVANDIGSVECAGVNARRMSSCGIGAEFRKGDVELFDR